MKKKNTNIWIVLLVLPFVAMLLTTLAQIMLRLSLNSDSDTQSTATIINLVSVLIGLFMIVSLLLSPLWIIMLIKAMNHNKTIANNVTQQSSAEYTNSTNHNDENHLN